VLCQMPFVPLASRKRQEVILDDDKQQLAARIREKDTAAVALYRGDAPSSSGYRFGNSPWAKGQVRPDVPFKGATSTWRPPSADPHGPARQKDREQRGRAMWSEAHGMRQSLSSPILSQQSMTEPYATHPLTGELQRWQRQAARTLNREMADVEVPERRTLELNRPSSSTNLPAVKSSGLVNFPKYMLIHNCHLKQMDQQRFAKQEEERQQAEALASERNCASFEELAPSAVKWGEASWGAPRLRQPGSHWAGSSMAAGRASRTSNPFRGG